ncbi:hypothetical protein [Massilia sp. CFBP9026]|uniref:hypothetical protein n=1 Tax=Massilia sp. CFBP9026 TaxID=3096536 RepID=UPI002A6A0681|nr:hypothetical protein [Massilia sp. CFBP9026]MDY0961746.1 hypothetical protein [Massilia sp. CFBP9026]
MAQQFSVAVRNARLDAIEAAIGASPKLRFYSGAQPANCAAARTGTLLAELSLPADWMAQAANGAKAFAGSWSGAGAAAAGTGTTIGHFAIMDAAGTTCHHQGKVGATGDGTADMTVDNLNLAQGQAISVTTFTQTDGGA